MNNTSTKPKVSKIDTSIPVSDSSDEEKMDASMAHRPSQFDYAMSAILHQTDDLNLNASVTPKSHNPDALRRRTIRVGSKAGGILIQVQELHRDLSKYVDDLKYTLGQKRCVCGKKSLLHIVDDESTLKNLMSYDRADLFDLLLERNLSNAFDRRDIKSFVDTVVGVVAQAVEDKCAMKVWPAGQLLAEYLFANPSFVAGKDVLEMGAGCGLASILCCKLGAKDVYATDAKQFERTMKSLKEMAKANGVKGQMHVRDLTWGRYSKKTIKLKPHIILGADIFFDERHFEDILTNIRFYFRKGCEKFLCVVQSRGKSMTHRLSMYLTRHSLYAEDVDPAEVRHLVHRSHNLKIEHTRNLRIIIITQQAKVKRNSLGLIHSMSRNAMSDAAASISPLSDDGNRGAVVRDDESRAYYKSIESVRKQGKTISMNSHASSEEEKFQVKKILITPPVM